MLRTRIITALIIAPAALAGVFLLPPFEFSLFIGAVLAVAAWEWGNLGGLSGAYRVLYAALVASAIGFASLLPADYVMFAGIAWWLAALVFVMKFPGLVGIWGTKMAVLSIGFLVLVPGWVALRELKLFTDSSYLICLLFFLIWGADVGAYFAGRGFGRSKLAPDVSPGKTWEGFFGGLVAVLVIAISMALWFGKPDLTSPDGMILVGLCLLVGMISVLGDLTISMFKRKRDIKDSSNLLPGHGGFLDRIDSLLSAAPVYTLYLLSANWLE